MLDKERKVSFVIPAYNEEESLEELYSLIKENVDDCKKENLLTDYEVLFIDDGSTDHTLWMRICRTIPANWPVF